jgi:hypothetical protein
VIANLEDGVTLLRLDPDTGDVLTSAPLAVQRGLIWNTDDTLITGSSSGDVRGFDWTGAQLWETTFSDNLGAAVAVDFADGKIFAIDRSATVATLEPDGSLLGSTETADWTSVDLSIFIADGDLESELAIVGVSGDPNGPDTQYEDVVAVQRCDIEADNCVEDVWLLREEPDINRVRSQLLTTEHFDDGSLVAGGFHTLHDDFEVIDHFAWIGRLAPL